MECEDGVRAMDETGVLEPLKLAPSSAEAPGLVEAMVKRRNRGPVHRMNTVGLWDQIPAVDRLGSMVRGKDRRNSRD